MSSVADPAIRFTDRVADYVRSRPSYPPAVLDVLHERIGLSRSAVVADVGSGTGLSARLFLEAGHFVYGVEPNDAMRSAAERELRSFANFRSVAGSAESSTLADQSVDLVVAGQAFHWFDRPAARLEFARLVRPGGWVVLMWNTRRNNGSAFLREYEALLQHHGTDYQKVRHDAIATHELSGFLGREFGSAVVPNEQRFDLEGLKSRVRSSSYTPAVGQAGHDELMRMLESLFAREARHGTVTFTYDTEVYWGRLDLVC